MALVTGPSGPNLVRTNHLERRKPMSVMVTVEWPAKPETLSEFLDVLKQALVDTRT